jgi:hypothetical protein
MAPQNNPKTSNISSVLSANAVMYHPPKNKATAMKGQKALTMLRNIGLSSVAAPFGGAPCTTAVFYTITLPVTVASSPDASEGE